MRFRLVRTETSDQGTFGIFEGLGLRFHSGELPWRDNVPRISCIPAGRYTCAPYSSPRFPDVYEVRNVPGRSHILIHSGNFAGDGAKGYRSDVLGCILIGMNAGELTGQKAVISSRIAMDTLRQAVGSSRFELEITDTTGGAAG